MLDTFPIHPPSSTVWTASLQWAQLLFPVCPLAGSGSGGPTRPMHLSGAISAVFLEMPRAYLPGSSLCVLWWSHLPLLPILCHGQGHIKRVTTAPVALPQVCRTQWGWEALHGGGSRELEAAMSRARQPRRGPRADGDPSPFHSRGPPQGTPAGRCLTSPTQTSVQNSDRQERQPGPMVSRHLVTYLNQPNSATCVT